MSETRVFQRRFPTGGFAILTRPLGGWQWDVRFEGRVDGLTHQPPIGPDGLADLIDRGKYIEIHPGWIVEEGL